MRSPRLRRLLIASGNAGKIREIKSHLCDSIDILTLADVDLPQVDETADTFVENALAKARSAAMASSLPALADDSGLCVPALGGAPGVHSARYAGEQRSDADNNAKLLAQLASMKDPQQRHAYYIAVIVLVVAPDDPMPLICQGVWHGEIALAPRGDGGFGYDPIFFDSERQKTGAEMTLDEKMTVSHRGKSLRELTRQLAEYHYR